MVSPLHSNITTAHADIYLLVTSLDIEALLRKSNISKIYFNSEVHRSQICTQPRPTYRPVSNILEGPLPLTPTSHSCGPKEQASPTHTLTPLPRGPPALGSGTEPTIQARSHIQTHPATLGTKAPFRAADPPRPSHMANASHSIVRIGSFCIGRYVPIVRFAVGKDLARGLRPARRVAWDRRLASRRVEPGGPELGG